MLNQPNQGQYAKQFKGGSSYRKQRGVVHQSRQRGRYGLIVREPGRLSLRQLESTRRVRRSQRSRLAQISRRVYPRVPVTAKPRAVRIGKGKGSVEYWAAHVTPGMILFERYGTDEKTALHALKSAGQKRSIKTKTVIDRHVRI